ncbi:MAG: glycosyltransferase [Lachnospiraceae bacterium]|nr:glycosyltransferase [Lachnospiraceae bacterium]
MQTLLSVMEQGDPLKLIGRLNIRTDAVIINQCDRTAKHNVLLEDGIVVVDGKPCGGTDERRATQNIRIVEKQERGLSKSRNLALFESTDDICIFCDNDVKYTDDAPAIIEDAFERYPGAGVICFFIERPERHEPVRRSEGLMSKKDMMRIFSPEIAVRKSLLGGLRFDEDFGAGAEYRMGEENIFLFEAARRGIQRVYIPVKIAETLPNESTWFTAYDRDFYISRGANYEAMDGRLWHILTWQNLIRKRKEYKATISTLDAYRAMKEGRRRYRDAKKAVRPDSP